MAVRSGLIVHTQVGQADDEVCVRERVDLRLGALVQIALGEELDALDQGGVDLGLGLGRLHAEEADLHAGLGGVEVMTVINGLAVLQHVRAKDLAGELAEVFLHLGKAKVKLVVAEGNDIIAHGIHHGDGVRALGGADVGRALAEVTGVDENDLSALALQLALERGDVGIALQRAVHVVRVQDHGLAGVIIGQLFDCLRLIVRHNADAERERHDHGKKQGQQLLCFLHPGSSFCLFGFPLTL